MIRCLRLFSVRRKLQGHPGGCLASLNLYCLLLAILDYERAQGDVFLVIHSFLPIGNPDAKALILGSMPGRASLAAGQYYAHPRNNFWPIVGALFGAIPTLPYEERLHILQLNGIALWDVLASCVRESSLDSGIVRGSEIINDFETFFVEHPRISDVFFNGRKSEHIFLKRVKPALQCREVAFHPLPSTSPVYASLSYDSKLKAWEALARKVACK